ncbi:PH domain-containing protein [Methanobrevibacter curvatus]|uniref:Bacterial membrane flanked domain protein n=1 Tax=Methanobrevibacter curvatus TaxID=49547 RepID=A0A166B108_9EURY|nr:PH domain-containing protein [Methanobrevibacter curvatus]KZX12729.1 bacterial membrane flanked domain protein [Methanobrevibacter curvatus]
MNNKNNNFIGNEEILYQEKASLIFQCKKGIFFIVIVCLIIANMSYIIKSVGKIQNMFARYVQIPLTEYITLFFMGMIFILIIWTIWILVKWINTEYIITNSRVIVNKGVLMKKSEFFPMQKIQDIEINKGIIGRIFKVGDINIFSGYDEGSIKLKNIKTPDNVENIIFTQINKNYSHYRNPTITPNHNYQNQDINNNYSNFNEHDPYNAYQNQKIPGNIKQDHMVKHYNPQNPNDNDFSQKQKYNQENYNDEFDNEPNGVLTNNLNRNDNNNTFYDTRNPDENYDVKNYENERYYNHSDNNYNNIRNYDNKQKDLGEKREFFEEDIPKYSKNRTKEEGQAIRNKHMNRFRKI